VNVLIVYAHPEPRSFNGAMRDLAVATFTAEGHQVQVSDLYAIRFNPVLDRHDFIGKADPHFFQPALEQKHAIDTDPFVRELEAEMDKVRWADVIIFQFPMWWFSVPAILKGWVDRVFAAGFAYGGGRQYGTGVFKGKLAMCAVTTGAPEAAWRPDFDGEIAKIMFPINHGMFYFCGFTVLEPFYAYAPAHVGEAGRQQILADYEQALRHLETRPRLDFGH
jgi:NAD(P)H dehydrogenase (quinone)